MAERFWREVETLFSHYSVFFELLEGVVDDVFHLWNVLLALNVHFFIYQVAAANSGVLIWIFEAIIVDRNF